MFDFALIISEGVPKGAKATPYALMPRVFCCIEGEKATVYKNREAIRHFQHYENGIKKKNRVFLMEELKAYNIFDAITKNTGQILIGNKKR